MVAFIYASTYISNLPCSNQHLNWTIRFGTARHEKTKSIFITKLRTTVRGIFQMKFNYIQYIF